MDITPIYHVIRDSEGFKALERRSNPIVWHIADQWRHTKIYGVGYFDEPLSAKLLPELMLTFHQ